MTMAVMLDSWRYKMITKLYIPNKLFWPSIRETLPAVARKT